jgi:riboflavin synthase
VFTGIVEETGTFEGWSGDAITIRAGVIMDDLEIGQSVSIDGCCLTVTTRTDDQWTADIADETRKRTTINYRMPGDRVNLERAAKVSDRLGGHIVQGHVDAVGEIVVPAPDLRVRIPADLLRYVVEKGSITVNGVSLTVVNLYEDGFDVTLIPHTLEVTNLGQKKPGDLVNIEVDIMAKYAERLAMYMPQFRDIGNDQPVGHQSVEHQSVGH